jgi:hypothetical protein
MGYNMGYTSRSGRRPDEYASKSSHTNLIKDKSIVDFLNKCSLPKKAEDIEMGEHQIVEIKELNKNPIKSIIAIDGGYTEIQIKKEFPSATICFLQFGPLCFKTSDLEELSEKPFIDPEDIAKLKNIQRFKLVIPTKNISYLDQSSLINSVRKAIYDFFMKEPVDDAFIQTLKWFIFQEYDGKGLNKWELASCPICDVRNVDITKRSMKPDYTFECPYCNGTIYLTDVFRFHEVIDDELGAGGMLGYLMTLLEQIVLIHIIRTILKVKPSLLNEVLFIKDGPLAFFGQTANMQKPMRALVNHLFVKYNLFLVGLEKSGSFVEHADEISKKIPKSSILVLDNEYIYKYIIPAKADINSPYGRSTYYGNKIIYKSKFDNIFVATLPSEKQLLSPNKKDFKNLDIILNNLQKLRCDMYDHSIIPITLVNKLVSLADHPSSIILEKFAKESIK